VLSLRGPLAGKTTKPRTPSARVRVAYHEAGHAVLSAAINDTPRHVSIRGNAETFGRSRVMRCARPTTLVQVALAGFAAEHLLTGRRSCHLDREIGFAILTHFDPVLGAAFDGTMSRDGTLAVQDVLRTGCRETHEDIRVEVDRLYEVARESLACVWPAVNSVASALLERDELDRSAVDAALAAFDLVKPVFGVQRAHGLLALPGSHASGAESVAPDGLARARAATPKKAGAG
jgi:hypothetical protein